MKEFHIFTIICIAVICIILYILFSFFILLRALNFYWTLLAFSFTTEILGREAALTFFLLSTNLRRIFERAFGNHALNCAITHAFFFTAARRRTVTLGTREIRGHYRGRSSFFL